MDSGLMRRALGLWALFFCLWGHTPQLWGIGGKPLPRKILALYLLGETEDPKTKQKPDIVDTPIHLYAEVILNHLGLEVVYHSIEEPLPNKKEMNGYLGILTWFEQVDAVPVPEVYCKWAEEQIEAGRKLVILEDPGIFADEARAMPPECEEMFEALGVSYQPRFSDNPYYFEIVQKDSKMVEFERPLLMVEGLKYNQFQVKTPGAKVYLKMRRRDLEESESDLVFTTPQGGLATESTVNYHQRDLEKVQWRLNPLLFFAEAFGVKGWPRPDPNTLNGRRIFFSHIDGDGIFNISHIDNESFAGKIILEEILKRYPTLPITISLITGYLDLREYRHQRMLDLYQDLLSQPNLEAASHGHTHPLIWQKKKLALKIPRFRYSDEAEIAGSAVKLKKLLADLKIDKPVALFLWTGDCRPNEDQLAIPYQAGLLNMNGGDSRFDSRYDSYSFLHPLGFLRGKYRQIYAASANENIYTHLWQGPYYGFRDAIATFENTEHPIRIKPIDIYYHYYSGEVAASLKVLQSVYAHALAQEIFPIFASDYVKIVEDFFAMKIISWTGGGFKIENRGALKTIRFDEEKRNVDLLRSQGVLGFQHDQGSLYVFLDEGTDHVIYLTNARPAKPYLISASFHVRNFKGNAHQLSFEKRGWHQSEMRLGGMLPGRRYQVRSGQEVLSVQTPADGILPLKFRQAENGGNFAPVAIQIQ